MIYLKKKIVSIVILNYALTVLRVVCMCVSIVNKEINKNLFLGLALTWLLTMFQLRRGDLFYFVEHIGETREKGFTIDCARNEAPNP